MDGGGGDGGLGGMEPTVAQMRELERAQHKVQMLRQQIADGLLRDMSECCEVRPFRHSMPRGHRTKERHIDKFNCSPVLDASCLSS